MRYVLTTALIFFYSFCEGQEEAALVNVNTSLQSDVLNLYSRSQNRTVFQGNSKLFDQLKYGAVQVSDSQAVSDVMLNFDYFHNQLNVEIEGKSIFLDAGSIKGFSAIFDSDTIDYKILNVSPDQLLLGEVLESGRISLVRTYETYVKRPDFNPVLNTGSENHIIKTFHNLYILDAAGHWVEVHKKRKKNLKNLLLDENFRAYIKDRKVKTGDESELLEAVKQFNLIPK